MMKKIISVLLTLVLCISMVLGMTSCGDKDTGGDNSSEVSKTQIEDSQDESEAESTPEESSEADSGQTALGKYASIKEYVESDEVQSELESMLSGMDTSTMSMEVYGEDNKLVYSYTYLVDLSALGDIASTLDAALEEQASVFESVASSLKLAVDVENPVVVVEYLDKDGNVIVSKEFSVN